MEGKSMENGKMQKMMKVKGALTLLLLIDFLVVFVSGVVLLMYQRGSAQMANMMWNKMHTISGILMGVLVLIHFVLNYRIFACELRALFGGKCNMKEIFKG